MPPAQRAFPLALFLLLLCSCGQDNETADGLLNPRVHDGVPLLPQPKLNLAPSFATADSIARYAKGTVVGQLNRLGLVAREIESAHTTLNGGGWQDTGTGCLTRAFGVPADTVCTSALWICETEGGFNYSQTLDGPCVPETPPLSDWTRYSGFSNADGSSGRFRFFGYPGHGSGVSREWSWEPSSDQIYVDWLFYADGGRTDGRFAGALRWDPRDSSTLRAEFRWNANEKWDAAIALDGRSGRMTILRLDSSDEWLPRDEIVWQPAHGTWKTYDNAGDLAETRNW